MKTRILNFPCQLSEAIEIINRSTIQKPQHTITSVVICGLGGSGIGAKLVSEWVDQSINVPIGLCQNYTLPKFVGKETLVIVCSYSGNTEETLFALSEAIEKKAHIIGITSGGQLKSICESNHFDFIQLPAGFPPRAALAYSIVGILSILNQQNLITSKFIDQVNDSISFLISEQSAIMEEAASIAKQINNTTLSIYAEAQNEGLAIRGKQQFNENSKYLCRHHVIPEMNHNELVGWGCGNDKHSAIFLWTSDLLEQNRKRFHLTAQIIGDKNTQVIHIHAKGENKIQQALYHIHLLDWASYYLGELRNEDITEVKVIDFLKGELGKVS